ncbi:MAG: alpha-xylosidase [Massiliimalia sp.]|jgi:alpha-D-xyloside xylohydrolase
MKFMNGYWLLQDNVQMQAPKQLFDYRIEPERLTLYAACNWIQEKGHTLNSTLLTIEITSPAENVLQIREYHHKGGVSDSLFALHTSPREVSIRETEDTITFISGLTSAVIPKQGAFSINYYYDGALMTCSGPNAMAYMTKDGRHYMKEELDLDVGEQVYGLGERFTAFVKNGQTVDIWNEDGGTCSEQTYKNIPFYLTNRGYGIFVNHSERVSYEIASEKVNRVQFSVPGEKMEYCVIGANHPKDALSRYTQLTGKPTLPPAWSFGLWLSTSFTTNYDEDTVISFIDGMLERGIPLEVFHFDCCWMKEYEWCNFTWNEAVFPDPKKMLQNIHSRGIKVCVWINPYIGQKSPLFDEGAQKGYFLKCPDGSVWQWDMWQSGMALVDFTNPDATAWYQSKLEALLDMGVDCFKTDFGERIPVDCVYFDGSDPVKMHNYYSFLYNQAVFQLLERKRGKGEAVLFARSATAGGQQFPVHWGGDCTSRYTSMAETLRGGLSFALSGFGYWSHDIGGFENGCMPDIYKRWTQFGLLSSHSRYHGSGEYKVPWLYGEEAVDVTRKFTKLKLSLMPYLYRCAVETSRTGIPMMRPMMLEYPEDETCWNLDRQYLLGDSLLVAPIFREDGKVSYYLPEGKWWDFFTGEAREGGKWYRETYDYLTLPLMVREDSVLVIGPETTGADYDYTDGVTVHLYGFHKDGEKTVPVYDRNGTLAANITVTVTNGSVETQAEGLSNFQVIHHP